MVHLATAVIAVGGEYGTLSEIALALVAGTPVIGVDTWRLIRPDGEVDTKVIRASDPLSAAAEALRLGLRTS